MATITSKDGTKIAYDKAGNGPALVVVGGALSHRNFPGVQPLAAKLSEHFTVYTYDRRGRGESTDAKSYAVEREIEDIAALIDAAGGAAYVYGVSSGAALALQAAAKLGPTKFSRLALYEAPYQATGEKQKQEFSQQKQRINELIKTGKPGEAIAYFMSVIGAPPEALDGMKRSPLWPAMVKMEFTLAYDYAVLGDGTVPVDVAKAARVPALVIAGENTMAFMRPTADLLAQLVPEAERKTLPGQTHQVDPNVLVPVLIEFFKRRQER